VLPGFFGLALASRLVDRRGLAEFIARRQFDRLSPMGYFAGSPKERLK
jgi:hypothetical protein